MLGRLNQCQEQLRSYYIPRAERTWHSLVYLLHVFFFSHGIMLTDTAKNDKYISYRASTLCFELFNLFVKYEGASFSIN